MDTRGVGIAPVAGAAIGWWAGSVWVGLGVTLIVSVAVSMYVLSHPKTPGER